MGAGWAGVVSQSALVALPRAVGERWHPARVSRGVRPDSLAGAARWLGGVGLLAPTSPWRGLSRWHGGVGGRVRRLRAVVAARRDSEGLVVVRARDWRWARASWWSCSARRASRRASQGAIDGESAQRMSSRSGVLVVSASEKRQRLAVRRASRRVASWGVRPGSGVGGADIEVPLYLPPVDAIVRAPVQRDLMGGGFGAGILG